MSEASFESYKSRVFALYCSNDVRVAKAALLAENNSVELSNLKDDPGERHNLANENPERRDQMIQELEAWWRQTDAKVPSEPNPKYDPQASAKGNGKGKDKSKSGAE